MCVLRCHGVGVIRLIATGAYFAVFSMTNDKCQMSIKSTIQKSINNELYAFYEGSCDILSTMN